MNVSRELLALLDEVLSLKGRTAGFGPATPLMGAVPELDSMAVVAVITAIEERFGIVVDDDDLDGSTFSTVGSLTQFVEDKVAA